MTQQDQPLLGRTVLVVEDEFLIARDLSRIMERLGAEVAGPVASVDAALALIATATPAPDLAVLDIDLLDEKSYPIADDLERRGIPFVFATGFDSSAIDRRYAAFPRWTKPVSREALLAEIVRAMA